MLKHVWKRLQSDAAVPHTLAAADGVQGMVEHSVRIGILGASGYTGAELLRLLGDHPRAEIRVLTAERQAGKPVAEVWPQLAPYPLPDLVKIGDMDPDGLDLIFCCLPHATTQTVI